MSERYNLPLETARVVDSHVARCKNLGLILDKYAPARIVEESKQKGSWLQDLLHEKHVDTALAQAAYSRWRALMVASGATLFEAAMDWRMVIGLGGESVLETDLTLHHLYGIPFIPASALKGITRMYLTSEVEGYTSSKIEDDNEDVTRIFGSQKRAGSVRFFDAMPKGGQAAFAVDIMNPHYPDYYGGKKKSPTNDQNPIPVTFLTITETTFTFALAPRCSTTEEDRVQYKTDVENVQGWLQEALQNYGIGGKTSAGYGYFQKPTNIATPANSSQTEVGNHLRAEGNVPQPTAHDPDMQRAESAKNGLEALKESDVAGQINGYYQQWQQLKSADARELLAQAIVDTVYRAKREKASAEKAWYKDLVAFLEKLKK